MTRLASHVWVGAYLARLMSEGIHAHVAFRGDATAGAIEIKLAFMDGKASLFTRNYGSDGSLEWTAMMERAPEAEVDAALRRRRGHDPDLWVVEVEDPRGRHLLDAPGLEE